MKTQLSSAFFTIFIVLSYNYIYAQDQATRDTLMLLTGQVLIEQDTLPLAFATVYNEYSERGTITDTLGLFSLHAQKRDTIRFSFIGFETKRVSLVDSTIDSRTPFIQVTLTRKFHEIGQINVRFASWQQFKNQIITMQLEEPPTPEVEKWMKTLFTPYELAGMEAAKHNGMGAIPVTFRGWRDRSHEKVQMLEKQRRIDVLIEDKYNPKAVEQLTGLEGDEILKFMNYCNFRKVWLLKSNEYDILYEIKRLYEIYRYNQDSNSQKNE